MEQNDDYYKILGIPAASSTSTIHKAYQARFKELQLGSQDPQALQKLREAYTTLRNVDTRAQYDFNRLNPNMRFAYIPPKPEEIEEIDNYLRTNLKTSQVTAFMTFNDQVRKIDEPITAKDIFNVKAGLVWDYMKKQYKYNFLSHTYVYAALYIVPATLVVPVLNIASMAIHKTSLGALGYIATTFGAAAGAGLGALVAMHTIGPAANTAGAVLGNMLTKFDFLQRDWENEKGLTDGVRRTRKIADQTYRGARTAFFVAATLGASAGFFATYKPIRDAFAAPVTQQQTVSVPSSSPIPTV